MRIPDSVIDDVRNASDIVDVISSSVQLKKRGKNYVGRCPFHEEKTPSFTVSQEKQMYHCFGCGVGGNVFTFVMETEKVSFVEAVRTLAERAGITIPSADTAESAQATEAEQLYGVCREAADFFHANLLETVEGKLALEYFRHRGFSEPTIRDFRLGYSLNGWEGFLRHVQSKGTDLKLVERAGLLVKREDGSGYYDRFRGRAMFPIFSALGRIIAFGARKLREDDQMAKYINSPETPVYSKSRVLYGLYQSRDEIRGTENAILVEGYADVISLYQAGIKNCVASSGTALTVEQIQLLGKYSRRVTLVYDADSAGSKATIRGVDLIIEQGLDVGIVELPAGDDPDTFVRAQGPGAFLQRVDEAETFLDFKARMFADHLQSPDGQARAVRSIVETIARIKDEIKQQLYIKSVSEKYGIYESILFRELEKIKGTPAQRKKPEPQTPERTIQAPAPVSVQQAPLPAAERDLLRLMLEYGSHMVEYVKERSSDDLFTHPMARAAIQLLTSRTGQGAAIDPSDLLNHIEDPALKNFLAEILFSKHELSPGWARISSLPEEMDPWEIADRCLIILHRGWIDAAIAENQRRMKEASLRGEPVQEFLEAHQSLLEQRRNLEALKHADSPDADQAGADEHAT